MGGRAARLFACLLVVVTFAVARANATGTGTVVLWFQTPMHSTEAVAVDGPIALVGFSISGIPVRPFTSQRMSINSGDGPLGAGTLTASWA